MKEKKATNDNKNKRSLINVNNYDESKIVYYELWTHNNDQNVCLIRF